MSDALRVALVAEGPTDRVVVQAALSVVLSGRSFVLTQLQPEGSVAFGRLGSGWTGIYRWCKQAAARGSGRLSGDALLFGNYNLLVLHLDADVADVTYQSGSLTPDANDERLPCALPCPPASATTNALRAVLLSWCGETAAPGKTVICMPSKSTEAWVVAALFPGDAALAKGIECYANIESRLSQQPKRTRIRKSQTDYLKRSSALASAWPGLTAPGSLGEALRFQRETLAAIR